jgi:flagellar hook-associated protein 2
MASIDGISSGLDTSAIINQLMALERRPMQLAQSRATAQDAKVSAWKDITSKVAAIRTATQPLLVGTTFTAAATTSTDSSIASAPAVPGTRPGSITFRVNQLATAHQVMTGASPGAPTDLVGTGGVVVGAGLGELGFTAITPIGTPQAGAQDVEVAANQAGGFDVTVGEETVTVAAGETEAEVGGYRLEIGPGGPIVGTARVFFVETGAGTTLSGLTTSLSAAGAVANAQILNIGTGTAPDHRMTLTSRATGSAGSLMVGSKGLNAPVAAALADLDTVTAVQNAQVQIGSGPGAVTVTRSSNSVGDLLEGVTINLAKVDTTKDVTVTVARDTAKAAAAVSSWVKSVNEALGSIDAKTAYNAATNSAAALTGSASARSLRASITSAVFEAQAGSIGTVSELGISIDRSGKLVLDQAALETKLREDPDAVQAFFARAGTSSSADVTYRSVSDRTLSGTYAVSVTQAAAAPAVTGNPFGIDAGQPGNRPGKGTLVADELLTISYRGSDVTYQATAGQTAAQVAAGLTAALQAADVDALTVDVLTDGSGDRLRIRSATVGSAETFRVKSSRGGEAEGTGLGSATDTWETHAGLDVAGTIGGRQANGSGNTLTAAEGDPDGLVVVVGAGLTGNLGSVTYRRGFAGSVQTIVGASGFGQRLADGQVESAESQKKVFEAQIGAYERRLELTEKRLRKEFSALENMMSNLQGQNALLLQQLNSMNR